MAKVEIKDKNNVLLAVFDQAYSPLDQTENNEVLKDVYIDNKANDNCVLSFSIPSLSEKKQYITPANYLHCDGKVFCLTMPDSIVDERNDGAEWEKVTAYERWVELDRVLKTICNDANQTPVNDLDIIITVAGAAKGGYLPGSAGSALSWLLEGTGWTLDTVDVTGTHELKMSQESVLAGIKKVQQIWGGWLVWNSFSKKLSLRNDSWQPDNGYQIRLEKNLKGVIRTYDNDFVTKLWVFGQNDVDIFDVNIVDSGACQGSSTGTLTLRAAAAAVNGAYIDGVVKMTSGACAGQERRIVDYNGSTKVATLESNWNTSIPAGGDTYQINARFLLDFSYQSILRASIYQNQDVIDPTELKSKGQEVHAKLKAPRVNYKVEHLDLRTLPEHSLETFGLFDMVEVVDEILGIDVSARVIRHKYNVFAPWDCDIEVGEESYEIKKVLSDMRRQTRFSYKIARSPNAIIIADGLTSKNTRRADLIVPPGAEAQDTFNRAVNLLPSSGGIVEALSGTYWVGKNANGKCIVVKDNVHLKLDAGVVLKVKSGYNYFSVIQNEDQTNGNDNIKISGAGTIDGNGVGSVDQVHGIYFSGNYLLGKSCFIEGGLRIKNFKGKPIHLSQYRNVSVLDLISEDNYWGLLIASCGAGIIKGCKISGNSSGLYIWTSNGTIQIIGNTIDSVNDYGIFLYSSSKIVVTSNTIQLCDYHGIRLYFANKCTIGENHIEGNGQAADNTYDGIFLQNSSENNIQSNTIRHGSLTRQQRYGINISDSSCQNNLVTNNDLLNSGLTGKINDAGTGTVVTAGNR